MTSQKTKTVRQEMFFGIGVAAVITDIPWGDEKKTGYPTRVDWDSFAKDVCNEVQKHNEFDLEDQTKAVELGLQDGQAMFFYHWVSRAGHGLPEGCGERRLEGLR